MMKLSEGAILIEKIFNENYAIFCAIAKKWTKDSQVAEDIVMDVFGKLIVMQNENKLKDFDYAYTKAWLFTAVRNASIDYWRAEKKKKERLKGIAGEAEQEDELELFDVQKTESIRNKRILDEINRMPHKRQEIMKLHYYESMTLDEISELLNITSRTVRNVLNTGIKKLREIFPDFDSLK